MVGGEQWGEVVDGPVGEGPWTTARWKQALTGQFAAALGRGELWTEDGTRLAGNVPVEALASCLQRRTGAQDRQIRGSAGGIRGVSRMARAGAQFPAIWKSGISIGSSEYAPRNPMLGSCAEAWTLTIGQSGPRQAALHITRRCPV